MYLRKKILIGNITLVLVLGFVVLKNLFRDSPITQELRPQSAGANPVEPAVEPSAGQPDNQNTPIRPINLFKTAEGGGQSPPAEPVIASVGEDLGLELCGTIAGSPRIAQAVIRDLGKKTTDIYRVDDQVADARILSIDRNQVVLLRGNQRFLLKTRASYASEGKKTPADGSAEDASSQPATTPVVTSSVPVDLGPSSKAQAFEKVLNVAKIEPFIENGETKGLRIDGIEDEPIAQFLGLKNGDVITMINGQMLTDKQKAFQVYKKVRTQPQMEMELIRDNKTKQISMPLR